MASSSVPHAHVFCLILFSLTSLSFSDLLRPNALVLPVTKHASTLQYVTRIYQRTPLVPVDVIVHLGGQFLWVSCDTSYVSSTYQSAHCHSSQCSLAHAASRGSCNNCFSGHKPQPQCINDTCILFTENVFTSEVSPGDLSEDVLSLQSTDGFTPGSMVSIPLFLFSCAPKFLLDGLANGAKGVAGLGHDRIGLPTQLSSAFQFSRKFAVCLPPTTDSDGVIFFGDGPYVLLPDIDVSKVLIYIPLILRPMRMLRDTYNRGSLPSYEYYIRITSIRVNGRRIPLNSSLLSINEKGIGGTRISTVDPYGVLESSIYKSLTEHFIQQAMAANVSRVAPVAPFDVCFSTSTANGALTRPAMPIIDLIFHKDEVFWRIFETNSMVPMSKGISCLGFLNGGSNPGASIIIGGLQLEDNLLQFDLVKSRLGFTSTLLIRQTSCANFNFS